MLDQKLLRNNDGILQIEKLLTQRHMSLDISKFSTLESERKILQTEVEKLQSQRNNYSAEVGKLKSTGQDCESIVQKVKNINKILHEKSTLLSTIQNNLRDLSSKIPNQIHSSVKIGTNEQDNEVIREHMMPTNFAFTVKDHVALGERGMAIDMQEGANLAGTRFAVLRNDIARLHRALVQFMLDIHTQQHEYQEIYVPYLVNLSALYGAGQLPKFKEDLFCCEHGEHGLGLIPTSEVPLVNLAANKTFSPEELPLKFTAHSPCFRSEAGSYGKDMRGLIRMHQFEKVELVQFCTPDQSWQQLEEITAHAEKILQLLELPYRVVSLCSGDLGFCAAKTYDLEVWLPSQNCYREISSCSNCTDFQARRINAKFKDKNAKKGQLIHTLNGSGLAISRTLVAILENFQTSTGSVKIPSVLVPYMKMEEILLI